jgi:succinate dehydrogenase/fumarate reductase cytochrome b subunit
MMLGAAMANRPIHGTILELYASAVLALPFYIAYGLNLIVVPVAYILLARRKQARPAWSLIVGYLTVTATEYIVGFQCYALLLN